jgi:hypothetical protein
VTFPISGAAFGIHLKVLPASSDRQIQLVSAESVPGVLV